MAHGPVSHIPLCAGTHSILVNFVQYDTAPYEQHYIVRMNRGSHDASCAVMMSGIPMFVRPLTDGMQTLDVDASDAIEIIQPQLQGEQLIDPSIQQRMFVGTHPEYRRTLADSHIPKKHMLHLSIMKQPLIYSWHTKTQHPAAGVPQRGVVFVMDGAQT